ncbi:MAG: hypothetical protein OXT03_02095, partial [Alphaproteobacteria bacterium]|nr:hypothetical protein [Alphaproteobacteria bacterium]
MRLARIFFTVGWGGMMLAAIMSLPTLWAVLAGDLVQAGKFVVSALLAIFLSGSLILIGRGGGAAHVHKNELFLTAVLFFTILPLLGALPLIGTGNDIGFWAAYFEAVSGLTTTGASIYANPEYETGAVLLWRALLGWLGGLWMLSFCIAIIAPFGIGGVGVKAVTIRQSKTENLPRRLRRALRQIWPIYLGLTLLGIMFMWLSGAPFFDALCLSLSAISTTGFVPDLAPLSSYLPPLSIICLLILMLLGATSYPLLEALFAGRFRMFKKDTEAKHFLYFILCIALFMLFAQSTNNMGYITDMANMSDWKMTDWGIEIVHALTNSISLLSTTALPIYTPNDTPLIGFSILAIFIPVMIGGMCLSTAGGLKILRATLLLKRIWREVRSLPFPSAIVHLQYGGRHIPREQSYAIWVFFIFFLGILALSIIIASLFMTNFNDAWLA